MVTVSENENETADPADRAMEAMNSTVSALEKAHSNASNAAEAGAAEHNAVSTFVETIGECLANGLNQPVGLYAGAVSEECEYYSKTDLKQQIKDASEEHRGGSKTPLDEFIEDRLRSVTVVKTTDHRQGAEYIWDFGTFKVETRSGKDGRGHFAWPQMRDLIHESGGVNTAKPHSERRGGEEWRDFIVDQIDERGRTQRTRGPRTEAYEALHNELSNVTGYGTASGALDHTCVWVIRDETAIPDWWSMFGEPLGAARDLNKEAVQEVRVHESIVKRVLDDVEITRSALYHELSARNLTVPGNDGASMTAWVDGSNERWWTLQPDAGVPRTYVPDPHAGAKASRAAVVEKDVSDDAETEPAGGADGFAKTGDVK